MSLKVIGSEAKVHWLTNARTRGKLTEDLGILYVVDDKLGQATARSYAGLKPGEAFERRYNGQKSSLKQNFVASDIIVFDKIHGEDYDYDDHARALIHDLHRKGRVPFSANYNRVQVENTNSEAMPGFRRKDHLETLVQSIAQSLGIDHYFDTKDPITWRWQQYEDALEILGTLYKHHLCLYAAYTSRGKTKIAMEVATQLCQSGGLVLVTTPITDTKKSFQENINDFHFGVDRTLKTTYMDAAEFAKTTVSDLKARAKSGELIFIVLTVQDLRYGDSATRSVRKKYQALNDHLDLWIRDERHSQYGGDVTSERLAEIAADYELDLTATPYNVIDRYRTEHIVSRTLLWGLKNRIHTGLPAIAIDAINTPFAAISDKLSGVYSGEEGFDPRKLFVRESGNFTLEAELIELSHRFYHSSLSKRKNTLSIVNDTGLSSAAKLCGMWVLPQGMDGDSAGYYIPALAEILNRYHKLSGTFYLDSYTAEKQCPSTMTIGDYVKTLVEQYGRVVILTCGKFLTGTDIPVLGHVVLFDKMSNIAGFEQLMGRMIRQYPGKDQVKLYTLTPGSETGLTLARMAQANATLGNDTAWEVLECVPLTEYDTGAANRISPSDMLAELQQWCRDTLRRSLPLATLESELNQIDTSMWTEVDHREFRVTRPSTELTDDNGAQVRVKVGASKKQGHRNKNQVYNIADTIQAFMSEAAWVAYSLNDYRLEAVLNSDAIELMFGNDVIAAICDSAIQSPGIERILRDYLSDRQAAYSGLSPEEVYDELFVNTAANNKIGMVYNSFDLVNDLLDKLPALV